MSRKAWSPKKSYMVFGKKVDVVVLDTQPKTSDGLDAEGIFYPYEWKIVLDGALNSEQMKQTLYHELGHALMFRTGLTQANISPEIQEMIVEIFATFFAEN